MDAVIFLIKWVCLVFGVYYLFKFYDSLRDQITRIGGTGDEFAKKIDRIKEMIDQVSTAEELKPITVYAVSFLRKKQSE